MFQGNSSGKLGFSHSSGFRLWEQCCCGALSPWSSTDGPFPSPGGSFALLGSLPLPWQQDQLCSLCSSHGIQGLQSWQLGSPGPKERIVPKSFLT